MVRVEIIRKRLNKLDEYLSILEEVLQYRLDDLKRVRDVFVRFL